MEWIVAGPTGHGKMGGAWPAYMAPLIARIKEFFQSLTDAASRRMIAPMITRLTGKNQVTVPAEIAGKAGLRQGSRLDWRTTDRADVLEVHVLPDLATTARGLQGRGARFKKGKGSVVARLIKEREQEDRLEGEL